MSNSENEVKSGFSKALSLYNETISNTEENDFNNLFSTIVNNEEVNIKTWEIKDYVQFLKEIDPINKLRSNLDEKDQTTSNILPNLFISLVSVLQEVEANDIDNQIYNVVTKYLYDNTEGNIKDIVNYIIPNKKEDLNEKATAIITILISSIKALLDNKENGIKELFQNVLENVNQIEIGEGNDKTNNSEYLNFMLSLFSELFGDLELKKVIKILWEVTNGNTEQIAEYISYLLYEHQANQKEDEGAESKHFGLATRIVIEEYIVPVQQKKRRQLIRNRNKSNEASSNTVQTEEEAANADLNEIYSFIKQVLHYTCLDDDQNGYPKELALFFSSFEDFWEPDMIIKFMVKEINASNIEENYKEYYGPFLMDLADLMNWTNKQCESALLIITEGWKRKSRISLAKMMGLSLNDIKHLYSDCKDLTYNDNDYLSDSENANTNSEDHKGRRDRDFSKTKKPVVLSIRGSDFKRSFAKPLTNKDNLNNGNNKICRFYGTKNGCSKGKHCPFKHIQTNRSSYISRRLNHSIFSKTSSYGGGKFGNNSSRYHYGNSNMGSLKHKSSFQNSSNYRNSSFRNSNDIKNRMSNREPLIPSNDSMLKYGKKGDRDRDRDHHDKMDRPLGKKDLGFNHKLRKQASFMNTSSYRHQTPQEYKPIEAIDPALPQHNHSNICNFYNSPGGCDKGNNCKFLHINANSFNSNGPDNRHYDRYGRGSNRKSFNSYTKSYNGPSGYNSSYNNDGSMNKGHMMSKKPSRSMMRNADTSKPKPEFNNYKKGISGNDDGPKNANSNNATSSITIVNSSQQTNDALSTNAAAASNAIDETNESKLYSQTPCVFFSKEGKCKYGDTCKFLHAK
ncbi:hypothetical protein H8356DRAFT_929407 [Neocallimastix lanati (nom. inval.)]|jgi:hypothetical protein|nr:hypothetical protein H8356DRAFT_929407 [Neocallimastix sp. JGI-2020a]